jgi:hypothetical protein
LHGLRGSETTAADFIMEKGPTMPFFSASAIGIVFQELREKIMELTQMADLVFACSLFRRRNLWLH